MTRISMDGMLEDAASPQRSADLELASRRCAAWDAQQLRGIDTLLLLCDGLRALFGEPDVDERPIRGTDFRL